MYIYTYQVNPVKTIRRYRQSNDKNDNKCQRTAIREYGSTIV